MLGLIEDELDILIPADSAAWLWESENEKGKVNVSVRRMILTSQTPWKREGLGPHTENHCVKGIPIWKYERLPRILGLSYTGLSDVVQEEGLCDVYVVPLKLSFHSVSLLCLWFWFAWSSENTTWPLLKDIFWLYTDSCNSSSSEEHGWLWFCISDFWATASRFQRLHVLSCFVRSQAYLSPDRGDITGPLYEEPENKARRVKGSLEACFALGEV